MTELTTRSRNDSKPIARTPTCTPATIDRNAPLDHNPTRLDAAPNAQDRFDVASRQTGHAADAYLTVKAAVSGKVVTDGDCCRAVDALTAIPPADVARVLAQLTPDERQSFFENLDGNERSRFVDVAMRAGIVAGAVVPQPSGWGAPPSTPRLAVNAASHEPALRDLIHDENCVRASEYQEAHGAYCDRYQSEVLDAGDPVLVGDRIRRNPVATSALPKFEPGTEKEGPHSAYRAGWRAARGPDHDYKLTVARSEAMTLGRAVRDDILSFELEAKVNVTKNVTIGGGVELDAAGRFKEGDVGVSAKTGVLETGAKLSFDESGEAKVGVNAKLSDDVIRGVDADVEPSVGVTITNDGSVKVKHEIGVESDDPQQAAKTERQKARADRGHDFSGMGVSYSSEHGGTVGVEVAGAQLEVSSDGHVAAGLAKKLGPVELKAMIHMDTSKTTMREHLSHVGGIRAEEIPVDALEQASWDELPPAFRAELEHQLWSADLWNAHRSELADKKETAQRLLLVQR
jgi:hypothetical protein